MTVAVQKNSPSQNYSYYGNTVYWNDFPEIQEHLNRLITGDPHLGWIHYLKDRYPPAGTLLAFNCGNGWVERDLFSIGMVDSVIGTDIQESSLATAREEARKMNMPAIYQVMDVNKPAYVGLEPDWVLNFAALHHVTFIDRLLRELYFALPPDGLFVNYDYVGPHRNQYGDDAWQRMVELAEAMPVKFRPDMRYPHMPTMLAVDPTEAVHSELITTTIRRYFDVTAEVPLGGGLAYHLLYENKGLYHERTTADGAALIRSIIEHDVEYTRGEVDRSLFAFILCRPKKRSEISRRDLLEWSHEEFVREETAKLNGGRYYPETTFETLYESAS